MGSCGSMDISKIRVRKRKLSGCLSILHLKGCTNGTCCELGLCQGVGLGGWLLGPLLSGYWFWSFRCLWLVSLAPRSLAWPWHLQGVTVVLTSFGNRNYLLHYCFILFLNYYTWTFGNFDVPRVGHP